MRTMFTNLPFVLASQKKRTIVRGRMRGPQGFGDPQLGQKSGDAMLVDADYAENAGDDWQSVTPDSQGADDVQALITPNDVLPSSGGVFYVQFKDPPNAQLWKYDNQTEYMQAATVNQGGLVAQAQLVNGAPPPGVIPVVNPGPVTPGPTPTTSSTTISTPVLVVGAVVLVAAAGGLAYLATRGSHPGASAHPALRRYR